MKERNDWQGMWRVARFNWPFYAFAFGAVLAMLVLAFLPIGLLGRLFCFIAGVFVLLQAVLSLLASHWIYDCSALKDWHFLTDLLPGQTLSIVNVHSGYDETSEHLAKIFPTASLSVVDLYPSLGRRETSIVRARKLYPPTQQALCTTIAAWPIPEGTVDLVLMAFAAHELRDFEQRLALFKQARSVLKVAGRIILVEHMRDGANFVVFNLGMMHFFTLAQWLCCAEKAGLKVLNHSKITPLVVILTLCL